MSCRHLACLVFAVVGAGRGRQGHAGASDILALLDLAREYKLRVIVQGGAEAWRIAPALATARVPVVTGAQDNIPAKVRHARGAAGERRAAAPRRRQRDRQHQRRRRRSTSATSSSRAATPSPTACRGARRGAR